MIIRCPIPLFAQEEGPAVALRTRTIIRRIILVHFIHTHDNPVAREIERRHKIIARDDFKCVIQGCTSRAQLQSHHLWHRIHGGCDDDWNQVGGCAGHHGPLVHGGIIDMGGFAPDQLITRLGINPRTGLAFASYRNERRIPDDEARQALDEWRRWWRDRLSPHVGLALVPGEEEKSLLVPV